jgi:hypothetical protein
MRRAAWLLLLWVIAGCAHLPPASCAYLDPAGHTWCLLDSATAPPFAKLTEVELVHGKGREHFIADIENDAGGLRAALLTPLGQRLALASFSAGRIARQPEGSRQTLDTAALLAQIQFLQWPESVLLPALREQGYRPRFEGGRRELHDAAGKLVMRASTEGEFTRIEMPEVGLVLVLRDLPESGGAP